MDQHPLDGLPPSTQPPSPIPSSSSSPSPTPNINGIKHPSPDQDPEPTQEDLERELPTVYDGQIPLGDLLERVVQGVYAELSELAETMPNMSDTARKRVLADWVVKTKKQVVKLYAVTKWARDAGTVQKCMNITAFLMNQNQQFEDAIRGLRYARDTLDPARLRNHDLLTSLDVLTTGQYRRLPSFIRKECIPLTPLTDTQILQTLSEMEDTIRYKLKMDELVPVEMRRWRVADGRVYFTVPHLFETSLCLRGSPAQRRNEQNDRSDDGWFFVHVEFLIGVGGDLTGLQEFPREPTGIVRQRIVDDADYKLSLYIPLSAEQEQQGLGAGRPRLGDGVVDVPLVRVFNFLQMMSLSYQLEILWYQAQRMRSLGWADYLKVEMNNNRKSLVVSYWVRPQPPTIPGRPPPPPNVNRTKLPPTGGTLSISIVEANASPLVPGGGPARSSKARVLAELQARSKLGGGASVGVGGVGTGTGRKASDEVEGLKFEVRWETSKGAFGIKVAEGDVRVEEGELRVDPDNLDFEALLNSVIEKHTKAALKAFQLQLQRLVVFSPPGIVSLVKEGDTYTLQTHLVADEMALTTIDARTGRINLRDTSDLAAVGRGHRFIVISDKLNENPPMLLDALVRLRLNTITDLAEQKANYLGLQSYRQRNFAREELKKFGPSARGWLYIQLSNFPSHYLVLVITDDEFRYALISVEILSDTMYANLTMKDIGWLDIRRLHGENVVGPAQPEQPEARSGQKRKRDVGDEGKEKGRPNFHLETQVLREFYAYCCARVAYTKVEQQFKLRGIPYTHVNPTNGAPVTTELAHIQSSLARSVPALCVQSSDILSGAPAAEAAMPNIRVIPLNWWSNKKAQVVTCVKLKYVQQPMGKRAGANIIRPSKRIIYDTTEAVVSFLSEDVDTCVDEFLEEWARVSKMVVIAREVAQMAKDKKWNGVRLLSFDLQTVEFAYSKDYSVSISCTDQLSTTGGSFDLRFSRCPHASLLPTSPTLDKDDLFNPHDDAEPFMRHVLRHGRLAPSLHRLVRLLRDTLPIVAELEDMRVQAEKEGHSLDTFAKAAGWYRVLYGDLRHALDFRLMTEQRVAILDGSHSLFPPGNHPPPPPSSSSSALAAAGKEKPQKAQPHTGKGHDHDEGSSSTLGLRPIPGFAGIILDSIRDATSTAAAGSLGKLAPVDVGVVCDAEAVGALGRAIHDRVRARLKD